MDFRYPPEAEAFRTEFRAWLEANLPDEVQGRGLGGSLEIESTTLETLRAWNRTLADARYAAIAWPEEWGGRGAGVMEQVVYAEEMHRAHAPGTLNPLGLSNIAPAIIEHGTDEQKRTLLPRMLRGDDIWCQGFSEPNAGSDLASLRTQAVLDGESWIVNGQKTWNTLGHMANWCELLVRTDPEAPKHKGITCLLVDMTRPGVEVRPLVTITGDKEFNEIFFTDVRVPVDCTLGPVNEGWRVAMTTLAYERGTVAKLHTGTRSKIARLIDEARKIPLGDGRMATEDPVWREKLAATYLDGELLKLISDRALSAELHGRAMGPEGSIAKLQWSETEQRVAELATEILGPDALSGPWARDRVYSRALTIAGGTTQVNKNILAQRMLGLPRR
ncbi:MAG TPA: acyl-CoA dehydrogenase family protein [Acidimicrobiia bacterium]|jgi:alkylation response protein AidB-like acyl-CoA dehydrogenase|nr:acyl-CoA dehydrogenase family protein [Acidimicrobiia bacterium]